MIPIAIHADEPPAALAARLLPRRPVLTAPAPREVSYGFVAGRVAVGTRRVHVFVDGVRVATRRIERPGRFALRVDLPKRDATVRVVAEDADGDRAGRSVPNVYGLPRRAAAAPGVRPVEDRALARRVRALAREYGGIAAAYVLDLRTGRGAAWNARARFPAASTLKVPIAVEVLRRLRARPPPNSSLDRLLRRMLVESDNASANALLVWLGGSTSGGANHVNALMRSLGVDDSLMYGGYEVLASAARPIPLRVNEQPSFGVGKYTTAYDLARLHRSVHLAARGHGPLTRIRGAFGRRDARYLLWILAQVADRGKLGRDLPRGTTVLHKAGWIRQARHDAGVVASRSGSFVVAVLTWNAHGVGTSSDVLAGRIARRALDRFRAQGGRAGTRVAPASVS